ncbi:hypothetical protein JXQ70_13405 [bacterium]|nr:hypothetical protein [bacterium]
MMKKVAFLLVITVILAGTIVQASNMGFRLVIPIRATGSLHQNWFSLPYRATFTNAQTLLSNLNATGPNVSSVNHWNSRTGTMESWNGHYPNPGTNFTIWPGEAYMAVAIKSFDWVVVGTHNPETEVDLKYFVLPGSQHYTWIAIPYHSRSLNASSLMAEINADLTPPCQVETLSIWDTDSDSYIDYTNPLSGTDFTITAGMAVRVSLDLHCRGVDPTWTPSHY